MDIIAHGHVPAFQITVPEGAKKQFGDAFQYRVGFLVKEFFCLFTAFSAACEFEFGIGMGTCLLLNFLQIRGNQLGEDRIFLLAMFQFCSQLGIGIWLFGVGVDQLIESVVASSIWFGDLAAGSAHDRKVVFGMAHMPNPPEGIEFVLFGSYETPFSDSFQFFWHMAAYKFFRQVRRGDLWS